jgi:NAD(P)-dependent dehydrogenase (short-subunit alcohol dehydrogenase family)
MVGKTCLVTGATSGIGKVTARELARNGARVVLTARDVAKGDAVQAEILREAPGAQVAVIHVELSSVRAVRNAAAECRLRFPRLDVLVNNAGAIFPSRQTTMEGLELTFATNHLAYFLLTRELLELLKASAPSRIVNVASNAHRRGRIQFDDLQLERGYTGWRAYAQSKLANLLFTRELARRLVGTGVTANSVHPGVVATSFGRGGSFFTDLGYRMAAPFLLSPEKGARTTLFVATAPELETHSGGYFVRSTQAAPSASAQDDVAAKRLWEESERILQRLLGP